MKTLIRIEEMFLGITLLLTTIIAFINVLLRQVGLGMVWTEELIRYLIIWISFIGASVCVREGSHLSIDAIPSLLKGTAKKILMGLVYLICLIFSIMLTWYSYVFIKGMSGDAQLSPALQVPMYYFYFAILISGILIMIRYLILFIQNIKSNSDGKTSNLT